MASQITSLTIVYSTVYWGADHRNHRSSASLAFVWGIHRWPVNSPDKWPVTRKMFPFDDVIMRYLLSRFNIEWRKILWLQWNQVRYSNDTFHQIWCWCTFLIRFIDFTRLYGTFCIATYSGIPGTRCCRSSHSFRTLVLPHFLILNNWNDQGYKMSVS